MKDIIWMFGGGWQSIAILTYIAHRILPKPTLAVMADTSRESSLTWQYLRNYAMTIFDQIGIDLVIVPHSYSHTDLYDTSGYMVLPAYTETGKLKTLCSYKWKRDATKRYLREIGYGENKPIIAWFGMSLDEVSRMRVSSVKWIHNHYPLCFDYKRRRHECGIDITNFGLPIPPKSSCWMCPNRTNQEWQQLRDYAPDDFISACGLDRDIREQDKFNALFLHKSRKPLAEADLSTPETCDMFMECANECWT